VEGLGRMNEKLCRKHRNTKGMLLELHLSKYRKTCSSSTSSRVRT